VFVGIAAAQPVIAYLRSPGTEDLRPVVSALSSAFRTGDRIYVYYGAAPAFQYYYRQNEESQFYGAESRRHPRRYIRELKDLLRSPGRLWLVFSHCHQDECTFIHQHLSYTYPVQRIAVGRDTSLYLVR
jgi:hypothetical protein